MIEPIKLTRRNAQGGLMVPVSSIGAAGRLDPDHKIEASVALSLNGQMTIQLHRVERWTGRTLLSTGSWETVYKR